jgi:hypothetical protein
VPGRLPKHGTRTGLGRHGHGGLRAEPGLARAKACRAMGYVSGRSGLDMYSGETCEEEANGRGANEKEVKEI